MVVVVVVVVVVVEGRGGREVSRSCVQHGSRKVSVMIEYLLPPSPPPP